MNRCALCPGRYNCVPPSGPTNVEDMFIGEAPGRDEDKHRMPFVGKTGQEVDGLYLPTAGMRRPDTYFTNAIKCLPDTPKHKLDLKKPQVKALIDSCSSTLMDEIASIQPKLLIPLGAIACWAIDPAIDLDLHHGMPFKTRLGITAFPMRHPARGLHSPKDMLQLRTDWWRLRQYKAGKLLIAKDLYTKPDYRECNSYSEIAEIDPTLPMACDTESSRSLGPYCITYSQCPGTARLIRASKQGFMMAFNQKIKKWESKIYFHNWLYDWPITEKMGLEFNHKLVRDTMIRAYHLGNLPQGLKALCFRELGMAMQDFDDLVKPYSRSLVLDWLRLAYMEKWPKPEEQARFNDTTGMWKVYKPQSMNTKLKRFFGDLDKNDDKDPFTMCEGSWEDQIPMMEEVIGPYPGKDIAHVPWDEALIYACKDADGTLRINEVMEGMIKQVRKLPQEKWRIA